MNSTIESLIRNTKVEAYALKEKDKNEYEELLGLSKWIQVEIRSSSFSSHT